MRLWLQGTPPIPMERQRTRRAAPQARLREAVRLVLLWAEAQQGDPRATRRQLP